MDFDLLTADNGLSSSSSSGGEAPAPTVLPSTSPPTQPSSGNGPLDNVASNSGSSNGGELRAVANLLNGVSFGGDANAASATSENIPTPSFIGGISGVPSSGGGSGDANVIDRMMAAPSSNDGSVSMDTKGDQNGNTQLSSVGGGEGESDRENERRNNGRPQYDRVCPSVLKGEPCW
jgi:hypothetical protein